MKYKVGSSKHRIEVKCLPLMPDGEEVVYIDVNHSYNFVRVTGTSGHRYAFTYEQLGLHSGKKEGHND